MSAIDVAALLLPVDDASPAGADLEYDPDVLEVMRLSEGSPERVMGDTTVPAEEPDWRQVQAMSEALLLRSKDFRIALLLVRALIRTASLPGLLAGMQLLKGLIERYWDSAYPLLDAGDDNDPTERMNLLASLVDPNEVLGPLRDAPLIHSKVFGRLSLRDLEIAEGKAAPKPDQEPLPAASVDAAFMDCDLDELTSYTEAAAATLAEMRALEAALAELIERSQIPNLDAFRELVTTIEKTLRSHMDRREDLQPLDPDRKAPGVEQPTTKTSAGSSGAAPNRITSREDVVRVLDALCDYYRHNEPSSPVPLLLRRARRLATKDFLEIMHDLVPEALEKVAVIKGPDDDER